MTEIPTHPVQVERHSHKPSHAPVVVTMRAYDVYVHLYGEQKAMVTGGCRGGFGAGELVAFLYARSFPKVEWRQRFDEALTGLNL
jgi:hypothetical protein